MMKMTTSEITTSSRKSPIINELTSLRGIFMMTIFLHHIPLYDGAGYMAVSFFFVLSGFSLTLGYGDRIANNQFSYCQYIKRRFTRLYPIHWLCLILILPFVLYGIYLGGADIRKEFYIFLLNSTLLQSFVPIKVIYFSWYLSDILFMAVLFPFLYRLIKRMPYLLNFTILLALVAVYTLLIKALPIDWHHAILYINPVTRLIDFVIGISVALLFLHWDDHRLLEGIVTNKKSLFIVMGVVSFLIMITISMTYSNENPYSRALLYWIPASLQIFSVSAASKLGGAFY